MTDTLSSRERSKRMSLVRAKDTKPEIRVRRLVYSLGYRYRLHGADLPGKPDIVFKRRKKAIFIHGCFWHRHEKCHLARLPKSRLDFWKPKLEGNKERDKINQEKLNAQGWEFIVIWECEIKDLETLTTRIIKFLDKGIV
jgi:DNA mismatch endonuclease (patch repair protein)